jgi:hypothetical protein
MGITDVIGFKAVEVFLHTVTICAVSEGFGGIGLFDSSHFAIYIPVDDINVLRLVGD